MSKYAPYQEFIFLKNISNLDHEHFSKKNDKHDKECHLKASETFEKEMEFRHISNIYDAQI